VGHGGSFREQPKMMKILGALLHMLGKAAEAAEAAKDDVALRKWVRAMDQIVQVEYEVHLPSTSPRHPSHLCAFCTLAAESGGV
jgi:hypothetical protein